MSAATSRRAVERAHDAQRVEITTKFFRGLTDSTRLRIVELLLDEGEQSVSDLVARLKQSQGRISSHLACLRWCGYVSSRREGKYVYYQVTDPRIATVIELARDMIAEHAEAILSCTRM